MAQTFLLRQQANDVYNSIAGLFPIQDFSLEDVTHDLTAGFKLVHRPTGYYFIGGFTSIEQAWDITRRPGFYFAQEEDISVKGQWENCLREIQRWLNSISSEISTPDLWKLAATESRLALAAADTQAGNDAFTPTQQSYIAQQIEELRRYIFETYQPIREEQQFISNRLDYLVGASKRQPRQDWLHTAIGVLFTIATGVASIASTPGGGQELFRVAWTLLRQVSGGALPLP